MPDQPTFQDRQNRTWKLTLDFVKLRAIRDKTAIDFGDLANFPNAWASFIYDDSAALDAVWVAIHPSPAPAMTDDWLGAMDGECLEAAREAMHEALVFFIPPKKRQTLEQAIKSVEKGMAMAMEQAEKKIDQALTEAMEKFQASGT